KQKFSYSKFIGALKKKNIALDRKSLAILAEMHPKTFEAVVKKSA
ncbi:MAG: 50S ribosomal protein L20, partial [bacterium]